MKVGDDKGVNYVYPVDWVKPKCKKQKSDIKIKTEIFIEVLFIEIRETTEETWLNFKDHRKQEQTLLYQNDTFDFDLVQYIYMTKIKKKNKYVCDSLLFQLDNSKDIQR